MRVQRVDEALVRQPEEDAEIVAVGRTPRQYRRDDGSPPRS
jgi:hypothetical protein